MSSETATQRQQIVDLQPGVVARATVFNVAVRVEEAYTPSDESPRGDIRDINGESYGPRHSTEFGKRPKIKVTVWRLLNTILVLGFGVYKAVAAYRGQQTASTTLDWILGVLWVITAYWISFLEEAELGPWGRWFFTQDHSGAVLRILTYSLVVSLSLFLGGLVWYGILHFNGVSNETTAESPQRADVMPESEYDLFEDDLEDDYDLLEADVLPEADVQPETYARPATYTWPTATSDAHAPFKSSEVLLQSANPTTCDNFTGGITGHLCSAQVGPQVEVPFWRLLNTISVLGLGVYMTLKAHRGQQTTPTNLDRVLGVLWAVMCV
ncbi:hypothetical protein MSAN_01185600 [Mycena sanguinolenta]|uniref:Uncharacterized protein n=1 Tax=Mycena sanguinolenta TaxID=230812 RepID=A0A8H6YPB3_9AGAR|nr:hypothetical protein MSAN_01185600 [Mycena sanguinolenta]